MRSFRLALLLLLLLPRHFAQGAQPALDASGILHGTFNSASSGTVSVSTTSAGDIVVLFIQSTKRSSAAPTVSTIGGASLTWNCRLGNAVGCASGPLTATYTSACFGSATCHGDYEEWWAYAASPVSAQTITVTMTAAVDQGEIVAFGVTNPGSSTSPFDPHPGLPATAQNLTSTNSIVSAPVTTTNGSVFVFGGFGSGASEVLSAQTCSGWTQGGFNDTTGPSDYAANWAIGQGFASAQSSLNVRFYGSSCTANLSIAPWSEIADAITNFPPVTGAGSLGLMGVGE